jgi:serine/threonine protein kinase
VSGTGYLGKILNYTGEILSTALINFGRLNGFPVDCSGCAKDRHGGQTLGQALSRRRGRVSSHQVECGVFSARSLMALHPNSQLLVSELERLPLLDGRFEQLKLVNFDETNGIKRGCFSLVFRAKDTVTGRLVALKFFDLDPGFLHDAYRRDAFVREHEILQTLLEKHRCLQLVAGMSTYQLAVPTAGGISFLVPCQYFAIEWLETSIDDYFLTSKESAAQRLRLMEQIILGVEALHRNSIFHRDLKADNLRAIGSAAQLIVVAIDLGTAARYTSGQIQASYGHSVGAPAYAPPEARAGLAGSREIAPSSDIYALGCLLFELFNPDYFYFRLVKTNPQYDMNLLALGLYIQGPATEAEKIMALNAALDKHASGIADVVIDGPGSTAPPGIAPLLNSLLVDLTSFDYRKRPKKLDGARIKIQAAIKILENQKAYDQRLQKARDLRRRKEEKLFGKLKRNADKRLES